MKRIKLGDLFSIKTGRKDSDFWIQSRGATKRLGRVLTGDTTGKGRQVKTKYHFGAKLKPAGKKMGLPFVTTLLGRERAKGTFSRLSLGSLNLQHLRKKEVEDTDVTYGAVDLAVKEARQPKLFSELRSMIGWSKK